MINDVFHAVAGAIETQGEDRISRSQRQPSSILRCMRPWRGRASTRCWQPCNRPSDAFEAEEPPQVLELGAISVHVSRKLSEAICRQGGLLSIYERMADAVAILNWPSRTIRRAGAGRGRSRPLNGIDLLVSGSEDLRGLIEGDQRVRLAAGALASAHPASCRAARAAGLCRFRLRSGRWLVPGGGLPEYPLSRIADAGSWTKLLENLGFAPVEAVAFEDSRGQPDRACRLARRNAEGSRCRHRLSSERTGAGAARCGCGNLGADGCHPGACGRAPFNLWR